MNFLSKRKTVIFFALTTIIMAYIVMAVVNPMIDGKNGLSVIALQLAFDKTNAKEIISSWNILAFKNWIFTDYIYALNYVLFFSSLLLWLEKKKKQNVNLFIYIAVFAGFFDWIENSLELWFLKDIDNFPTILFFIHSIFATLKWLALPIVLWKITNLIIVK